MFHDAFATSTMCVHNDGGPLLDGDIGVPIVSTHDDVVGVDNDGGPLLDGDIGVLITSTHDAVNVDNDGKPLLEH
jgi:hypothetical protein